MAFFFNEKQVKDQTYHFWIQEKSEYSWPSVALLSSSKQKNLLPLGFFFFLKSTNSSSKSTQNNSDCRKMSPSSIRIATVLLLGKNIYTILK